MGLLQRSNKSVYQIQYRWCCSVPQALRDPLVKELRHHIYTHLSLLKQGRSVTLTTAKENEIMMDQDPEDEKNTQPVTEERPDAEEITSKDITFYHDYITKIPPCEQ